MTITTEACGIAGRPNIVVDRDAECVTKADAVPERLRGFRFDGYFYTVVRGSKTGAPAFMRLGENGWLSMDKPVALPSGTYPVTTTDIVEGDKIAFDRSGDVWVVGTVQIADTTRRPTLSRC
jgi:hypothetical protein